MCVCVCVCVCVFIKVVFTAFVFLQLKEKIYFLVKVWSLFLLSNNIPHVCLVHVYQPPSVHALPAA